MIVPAVVGAVLEWPWLVTAAVVLPGFIAHEIFGYLAGQARGISLRTQMPRSGHMGTLAAVVGVVGVLLVSGVPKYALPLAIVLGLLLFVEPLWRLEWRRHNRRPQANGSPQGTRAK